MLLSRYGNYSFHNDYFWLIQLSGFQEAVSLKEEVADLEDELQRVKMNKLHTKSMLRTIFNMGASNEDTYYRFETPSRKK